MNDQIILLVVLVLAMFFFAWSRWRYDLVALAALLALTALGIVPVGEAFTGFGHKAVITVGAVLVLSHCFHRSGIVDMIAEPISKSRFGRFGEMAILVVTVTVMSGFMNNIGALALMLPVALTVAERSDLSPGKVLMPMAFGSLMGGLLTLTGTPPNIIISAFRADHTGQSFGYFEFTPIGLPVALIGILFLLVIGWRLVPHRESPLEEDVTPAEPGESREDLGEAVERGERSFIPALIFIAAIGLVSGGVAPVHIAFAFAAVLVVILGYIHVDEMYSAVDWPIIILLGAMIPVGHALETTGLATTLAESLKAAAGAMPGWVMVLITLFVSMALSNVINNAAAALVMAPIAYTLAQKLGLNADSFLMAVAVGASCAFALPIGHQSNLLVMRPGGYDFADYWRPGLPLSVLVGLVATALIVVIFPLGT